MADNAFFSQGCPPRMSDGRLFTDWNPRSAQDAVMMQHLGEASEHAYRKRLQGMGEDIIKANTDYFLKNATCECNGRSCKYA